jgi:LPS sulfotransferase NodH
MTAPAGHCGGLVYLVAATPRTGSSLLCAGLWATGIAGRPGEVFAPGFREPWRRHWSLPDDVDFATYLHRVRREGQTSNGVFSTKIQWMHVAALLREAGLDGPPGRVLDRLFAGALFVNTIRRDRRAQALSWYRAIVTGQWYRTAWDAPARVPVVPSLAEIRDLESHIAWQQSEWERHVAERGARCLPVIYEDLSTDYPGQIARVLDWLGLDASAARRLPQPHLLRQADDITDGWHRALGRREGCALASADPARRE